MTKTAKHSFLFRMWIHMRGFIALVIILFGVLVGLISLILPNEDLYKQYVIDFLSKQWDKEVKIESISGKWQGFGPNFIIQGLSIKGDDEVVVQEATLDVNILKYLIPKGSTGINLGINDVAIDFERKTSGKIVLTGDSKKNKSFSKELERLLSSGTLSVKNLSLNLFDSINQINRKISSKITVQQNKLNSAFALELDSKELADKLLIKSIAPTTNDFMTAADWYIQAENLSLNKLGEFINKDYFPSTQVDAQMWFSTKAGNIVELMALAELNESFLGSQSEISGTAELAYKGSNQDWHAELTLEDVKTESISQDQINIYLARKNAIIYLNADVLDVSLLKAITHLIGISSTEFDNLDINGKLTNVEINYDVNLRRLVEANGQFQQLDFDADFGKLTNLSGEMSLQEEQIRLLIDSDNGTAVFPDFIRGQAAWEKLLITAQTSMHDDYLDIKINSMWCDCNDFILDGAARISHDESLFLDLTFGVYDAEVNQLYKYWPKKKWKPKVLNFLDQALITGVVDKGMILYHGLVEKYPFSKNQGKFNTHSELVNAHVNYQNDWPNVKNFTAVVDTLNRQLVVNSRMGTVLEGNINQVKAEIKNLKAPILNVDIKASGEDNFLIDILKNSPMKKGFNVLKQDIVISGPQDITVNLDIPLNIPNVKVQPEGQIKFNDTDFQIGQFQLHHLNGIMDFSGFSLMLDELKSQFLNRDVVVSGEILNQPNKEAAIDILINGLYDVKDFESALGFDLRAQGQTPWLFSVSNKKSTEINFTAETDLIGVELNIPEPFKKSAEKQSPFSITCTLPCLNSGWDIVFDNKLETNFSLDTNTKQLKLNKLKFGSNNDQVTELPEFGGKLDVVDVDKWIEIVASNKSGNSDSEFPLKDITVNIGTLIFMSRELHNVEVRMIHQDDSMVFEVDGLQIKGKIIIAKDIDRKGIIVQLEKLHWPKVDIPPEPQNITKVSSKYPALHVWIGDFIYDGIPLGESSIEVRPVADGIMVEKFNTKSNLMSLNINGNWYRDEGSHGLSKFNIIMTSKDIAQFLEKLGFQAPISEAQTIIDMQANWPGFPSQFEIKSISGKMRIEVKEGEVVDAKPGMGRVLGLFSLTNLPRRLILDFKDVFGKGLHFKSMQGDFVLNKGEAYTDAFVIDSASANILVKGSTGLANQDYNQTVIVTPRVGRVLPTIGAIAGGAVGAAAGFLVQGMFSKGLKNVGKIIYKVTGSWDDPKIELIETEEKVNEN